MHRKLVLLCISKVTWKIILLKVGGAESVSVCFSYLVMPVLTDS